MIMMRWTDDGPREMKILGQNLSPETEHKKLWWKTDT